MTAMDAPDGALLRVVPRPRVPLAVKLAYTAFMAVLVPVYLAFYGPTNVLYFCDQALLLTLAGVWLENPLLVSLPAVGIVAPQVAWIADFLATLFGVPLLGMTNYMFDDKIPLYLRALSGFHGWLPLLLIYLVARVGYDRRAFAIWTASSAVTLLVCFFFMPGPTPDAGMTPVNINYVWGPSDAAPQGWTPPLVWLAGMIVGLPLLLFLPAHLVLRRFASKPAR